MCVSCREAPEPRSRGGRGRMGQCSGMSSDGCRRRRRSRELGTQPAPSTSPAHHERKGDGECQADDAHRDANPARSEPMRDLRRQASHPA
jgi:hypothetical protein